MDFMRDCYENYFLRHTVRYRYISSDPSNYTDEREL